MCVALQSVNRLLMNEIDLFPCISQFIEPTFSICHAFIEIIRNRQHTRGEQECVGACRILNAFIMEKWKEEHPTSAGMSKTPVLFMPTFHFPSIQCSLNLRFQFNPIICAIQPVQASIRAAWTWLKGIRIASITCYSRGASFSRLSFSIQSASW